MTGLGHEQFASELGVLELDVVHGREKLQRAQHNLERVARAAHAAGMTEREIARASRRSAAAVHVWLHGGPKK